MRVLVTGGRDFKDRTTIYRELDKVHQAKEITLLIHGDARGADTGAKCWADLRGVDQVKCPANWTKYGNAAGSLRNSFMLDLFDPELCVAFPGGRGTTNMMKQCKNHGVKIIDVEGDYGNG